MKELIHGTDKCSLAVMLFLLTFQEEAFHANAIASELEISTEIVIHSLSVLEDKGLVTRHDDLWHFISKDIIKE